MPLLLFLFFFFQCIIIIKEFTELLKRAAYHQVKGYDNILEFEIDGVPESLEL